MTSIKNNTVVEVEIVTTLVDETANKKKHARHRRISTIRVGLNDGEMIGDFMKRVGVALEVERDRVNKAVSNIASVRERMTSLAKDLNDAGFRDVAKQMERMAKDVVPSDDFDDDDDDEM